MSDKELSIRLVDMTLGDLLGVLSERERQLKAEIANSVKSVNQKQEVDKPMQIKETSDFTGYTEDYLRQLAFNRQIPHYKRGRLLYFDRKEVRDWMLSCRVKTMDEINRAAATHVATKKI